jgi:predicted amidohydrolase
MLVGFLQFEPLFGEIKKNVDRVIETLSHATGDLIVLPELFNTGYQFTSRREVLELSEPIPDGYTTRQLHRLVRDKGFHIVAGLAEQEGEKLYNSALLIGPQGLCSLYRKIHLFHEETLWFTPGEKGFHVTDIGAARIGIMICFDWIFPESARTLTLKGADLICHPSNLILPYCPDAMVTRAIENRIFTITANRIGTEEREGKPRLTFIGQSEIVNPTGQILYRASEDAEELHIKEINPLEAREKQINPYNHLLHNRHPTFYLS